MKIIFYGPIGGKKGKIIGGGESGNRKTIKLLNKLGFSVEVIEKPYPIGVPIIRAFYYPIQLFVAYIKVLFKLYISKNTSLHLSGFYLHLIYVEWLLIRTARIIGRSSVYELRAGGAIEGYHSRSFIYRYFFKQTLLNASSVICQGEEYVPFIYSITGKKAHYYPNYITEDLLIPNPYLNSRNSNRIELLYFGRIAPSKNIEFILDICSFLPKDKFFLEIIGGGTPEYLASINSLIELKDIQGSITITPPLKSEELFNRIRHKHFFIFPSKEKREGHSNALTEAMSQGVVPLVSNMGFNASVVKQPNLVVPDFEASQYASKILSIWENHEWKHYSNNCHKVVNDFFTESTAQLTLAKAHSGY
ncbi:hypothetical protein GCM10028803_56550 [Larkinella knui]|uniref:Glycosyltransferase family 1 protein n=1 Tax=Larkinella knui TaxID=2025310 RepID=A0A3P1CJ16_9BACT|nr:glycosyltransferase [Larkinella knui]RRB12894.1 glycosyltransferase family 1 protein [Larkinella knui]